MFIRQGAIVEREVEGPGGCKTAGRLSIGMKTRPFSSGTGVFTLYGFMIEIFFNEHRIDYFFQEHLDPFSYTGCSLFHTLCSLYVCLCSPFLSHRDFPRPLFPFIPEIGYWKEFIWYYSMKKAVGCNVTT